MRLNRLALASAAALALVGGGAALGQTPDPLVVTDSNGTLQSTCGFSQTGVLIECHAVYGWDGTTFRLMMVDTSGRQVVNVNGSVAVTGTFWQATQPVSAAALPLPAGAATSAAQTATQASPGSSAATGEGVQGVTGGLAVGVVQAGTVGSDYSVNQPTLPNIGANFAGSGPFASYVLIKTIPALSTRNNVEIDNASGAQIAVVRDDGTAAGGAAPVNASVFPLASTVAGQQGATWSSQTFKGRLQIYAPAALSGSAFVNDMVD